MNNIKRLSLKECWYYAKMELIPEARTFKHILDFFISRKTMNVVFSQRKYPSILEKIEIFIWNALEFHTRNLRKKLLW